MEVDCINEAVSLKEDNNGNQANDNQTNVKYHLNYNLINELFRQLERQLIKTQKEKYTLLGNILQLQPLITDSAISALPNKTRTQIGNSIDQIKGSLHKKISWNRFKLNILKNKYILFQNKIIQIGLKKQLQYDFNSSQYCLRCEIFYGNKSDSNLQISSKFNGNKIISVYRQGEGIKKRQVTPNNQLKQQLILTYNKQSNQLGQLYLTIEYNEITQNFIYIPILQISFIDFKPNEQRSTKQFTHSIQTSEFRLNKHLDKKGDLIDKYLPLVHLQGFSRINFRYYINEYELRVKKKQKQGKVQIQLRYLKDYGNLGQSLLQQFKYFLMYD